MAKLNEKVFRDLRFLNQKVQEIFAHFGDPLPDRKLAKGMDLLMEYLMSYPEFKTINDLSTLEQSFLTSMKGGSIEHLISLLERSVGKYQDIQPLFGKKT